MSGKRSDGLLRGDLWWWPALGCCCLLLVAPLWWNHSLPLVDLPQHAAQLAVGQRWAAEPGLQQTYELNPWASQLVVPAVAWVLRPLVGIEGALRVILSIALLGVPVLTLAGLRKSQGNPWWVFAVFPAAYGYAFWWGFLSFALAIPLGLWAVVAVASYLERPSWRGWLGIVVASAGVFFCHVLMLIWVGLAGGLMLLFGPCTWRARVAGWAALGSMVPVAVAWWLGANASAKGSAMPLPSSWYFGSDRLLGALSALVGQPAGWIPFLGAVILIGLPFAIGARVSRIPHRWMPLAAALVCVLVLPDKVLVASHINLRFAALLLPTLLFGLDPAHSRRRGKFVAVVIAVGVLLSLGYRFALFDRESEPARRLIAKIPAGSRVLGLAEEPQSSTVPWYPYLHFAQWAQVAGAGAVDPSFAELFPTRWRYRVASRPTLPRWVEWAPEAFSWERHGAQFDYVLMRRDPGAAHEAGRLVAPGAAGPALALVDRQNEWELWRRTSAPEPRAEDP